MDTDAMRARWDDNAARIEERAIRPSLGVRKG